MKDCYKFVVDAEFTQLNCLKTGIQADVKGLPIALIRLAKVWRLGRDRTPTPEGTAVGCWLPSIFQQ